MNYLPPIIDYTNWTMALSLRKLRAYITGDNQECLEVMGSNQEGIVEGSQTKIEYDTNGNLDIAHINTLLENHPDWINLVVTKWYNQAYNINTNPGVAPFVQYEGPGLAFIAINREIVHDKSNNLAILMIGEGKFRDHNIEWKDQGILDGHTTMLTHSFASQTNRTGGVGYIGQCGAAGTTFVSPGIKYGENQRHKYGMFISADVGYINAAPDGEASSIDICLITGRMTNINDERAVLIRKNKTMDFIVSTTKEALIDEVDDEYFVIKHSYEYINEVLVVNQALNIGDIESWEDNILAFWHVPIVEIKSVLIQGININRDVNATVIGDADFTISLSPDGNFTNSLTIPLNQARIGVYLYIKFKASAARPRQATIVLSSPGAENVEVLLSGQGLAA